MSDLIERQAAIDEAEEWIETYNSGRGGQRERDAIKHVISGIKKLPSAQPDPNVLEQEYLKGWEDGRKNLLEYISRLLSLPSAQSDWNELMVICDNCGHAIHVERITNER